MAKESSLWKWIKSGNVKGQWRRIDARGFPDAAVNVSAGGKFRRTFIVELKEIRKWREDGRVVLPMEPGQVAFFNNWKGECYIFAQIGKERYWFKGQRAAENGFIVDMNDAINPPAGV